MSTTEIANFEISGGDRGKWIENISRILDLIKPAKEKDKNHITLKLINISEEKIEPFHVVLLACFIEYVHTLGFKVYVDSDDAGVKSFLYSKLRLRDFYLEGQEYIESEDDKVFNLWKVVNSGAIGYSIKVTDYLNNKYFEDYDMTVLKVALDEVYANIADHAKANGVAYSFISYKPENKKIYVAVCDFGLGIAATLRSKYEKYKTDVEALRDSIEVGVSAQTNQRNRGYGLNTIVSSLSNSDSLKIVSNKAILVSTGGTKKVNTLETAIPFHGCLIYFEISTDSFPLREIEEEITIS